MKEWRPWDRLRLALRRDSGDAPSGPRPLPGLSSQDFGGWAEQHMLQVQRVAGDAPEPGVYVNGEHLLGSVEGCCLVDGETGQVIGIDLAVSGAHPSPPPDLTAFLLEPLAGSVGEPERSALDTWVHLQLAHRGPYNAVTTVGQVQVAIGVEDASPQGRTWSLAARAR